MSKKDVVVPIADRVVQRAVIDRHTFAVLDRWADRAGRTTQMHAGVIVRRIVDIYQKDPNKLIEMGVLAKSEVDASNTQGRVS